jgi:HlyD family secretion protein
VRAEEPPEPTLETATVTRGDIVIEVGGSGKLVPATELALTVRTSGILDEVLVEVGDRVREKDLLVSLETDTFDRAVADADVEVRLAQLELAEVRQGPSEAELADAEAALRDAQVQLTLAQNAYAATVDSRLDGVVDSRKVDFDWSVSYYQEQKAQYEEGGLSQADHDWAMAGMIAAEGEWQGAINEALAEEVQARNGLEQAKNAVYQAEEQLQLLESEPLTDTLARAELAVDEALLVREKARANLEDVQLFAPFDGTVIEVAATAGEQVGTSTTILTLADLRDPLLLFWVEEVDMTSVAVGRAVNVVFEALPDDTFTGQVTRVDPVLVKVGGTPAVQAWASLDTNTQDAALLAGMTAEVDLITAETRDALLVPLEALRELSPGAYAVFVLTPTGGLEMRVVTVGLTDPVNAEILGGLELGEVVGVGETE